MSLMSNQGTNSSLGYSYLIKLHYENLDYKFNHSLRYSERQTCFSSEDEVEIPVFHDKGDFISSPTMASTK
ncbi:hypothetical protein CsSME_00047279 [Camellia sinensis var. sinensis]